MSGKFCVIGLFCHGVPSKFVWDKYIKEQQDKLGNIDFVSWRNKQNGWHDSWAMTISPSDRGEVVDWYDSYNLLIKEKKDVLILDGPKEIPFIICFR